MYILYCLLISTFLPWINAYTTESSRSFGTDDNRFQEENQALKNVEEIINNPTLYNKQQLPRNSIDPVEVTVKVFIRNFNVCDKSMEANYDLTVKLNWVDPRLAYNNSGTRVTFVQLNEIEKFWVPDVFFRNSIETIRTKTIHDDNYIRVMPNGTILFSGRFKVKSSCPLDLKDFPFDQQQCGLRISSYGYSVDDLIFLFDGPADRNVYMGRNVYTTANMNMRKFRYESTITDYCNAKTSTGEYSCLRIDVTFSRITCTYIITEFIPCINIAVIGLFSEIIPSHHIHTRLFLATTSMVTHLMFVQYLNSDRTFISYTTMADVFVGMSMTIVFCVLLHATFGYHVGYPQLQDKHRNDDRDNKMNNESSTLKIIDQIFRYILLSSYFIFVIAYFYIML